MNVINKVRFADYVSLVLSYVRYYQNDDGTWTADASVLPGCITWGSSRSEAVIMAKDAIESWIMTALRFGDEIPVIDGCILQDNVDEFLK